MKPVTLPEWKQYLQECLEKAPFMALGTSSPVDGAWVNPVNFAFDEHFVLYFLSEPSCIHMQNIERDPRVSCAVYSTAQSPTGQVLGVQLIGKAQWVSGPEAAHACAVYFADTPGRKAIEQASRPEEYVKPDAVWRMAKVTPERMWVFDEKMFGGSRLNIDPEVFGQ